MLAIARNAPGIRKTRNIGSPPLAPSAHAPNTRYATATALASRSGAAFAANPLPEHHEQHDSQREHHRAAELPADLQAEHQVARDVCRGQLAPKSAPPQDGMGRAADDQHEGGNEAEDVS